MNSFKTIRNKIQAHLELKLVDGEYKQIAISEQNLKWDDPKKAILALQEIINILNNLIRRSDYAFDYLDDQLNENTKNYWD